MNNAMQLKARIKNMALKNHVSAQALLQNYMLERLLEKISLSMYKDLFILKGGMLIASLVGIDSRTTMDMDATLRDYPLSEEPVRNAFLDICAFKMYDEVVLSYDHITPIHEDDEYGGYRVSIIAEYETIKIPLKIDITTSDIMTPGAIRYAFHSIFENRVIEIWAYNVETILAEKIETILRRSVLNTRPRDFYDVYIIMKTQRHAIENTTLIKAIRATSDKRMSNTALDNKDKILSEIKSDPVIRNRWDRYCKENYYAKGIGFDEVIQVLKEIVDLTLKF